MAVKGVAEAPGPKLLHSEGHSPGEHEMLGYMLERSAAEAEETMEVSG